MNKSYLLIGGNVGDRTALLAEACAHIEGSAGPILQRSALYSTAAWGKTDQADFLNQALLLQTLLPASELMTILLQIEEKMGRIRMERYGPRTIDIDILFFNRDIIATPQLVIPHPELANRRLPLVPMDEIASGYIHPILGKSIHDLLAECPDKGDVKKLSL